MPSKNSTRIPLRIDPVAGGGGINVYADLATILAQAGEIADGTIVIAADTGVSYVVSNGQVAPLRQSIGLALTSVVKGLIIAPPTLPVDTGDLSLGLTVVPT